MGSRSRLILLTVAVVAAGCGRGHELPTAPDSGQVTIDGTPIPKGQLIFAPEQGRAATGIIQPDGTFVLSTYGDGDGAIVGRHTITVISGETVEGADPYDLDSPVRWLVPERYRNPATSGLSFQVRNDRPNVVKLELSMPAAGNRNVEPPSRNGPP